MAINVGLSPVYNGEQFFDNEGNPLSGGKIHAYVAGSFSTNQATYSDHLGAVVNSNPITLDSSGRPNTDIWLELGLFYNLVLKDALGTILDSVDNVTNLKTADQTDATEITREVITATAGQTVVPLTNQYEPGTNTLQVFVNGILKTKGVDYNETSSGSITFLSPLALNDKVTAVVYSVSVGVITSASLVSYGAGTVESGLGDALHFTRTETGAIERTVDSKLSDFVSVLDFVPVTEIAAIQNYTSTWDATAAIQKAVDTKKQVYLPAGLYNVHTDTGVVLPSGFFLKGDGKTRSIIKALGFGGSAAQLAAYTKGSVLKRAFTVGIANDYVDFGYLGDFSVILNHPVYDSSNYRQIAVDLRNITRSVVERVYTGNFADTNSRFPINLTVTNANATQGYGFVCGTRAGAPDYCGGEVNTIRDCQVWGAYKGIVLDDQVLSPSSSCHATLVDNCDLQGLHSQISQESQYNAGSVIQNVTIQGSFRQTGNVDPTIGVTMAGYNCKAHIKYAEMGTACDTLLSFSSSANNCVGDITYYSSSAPSTAAITDTGTNNRLTYFAPFVDTAPSPDVTSAFGAWVERFNRAPVSGYWKGAYTGGAFVVDAASGINITNVGAPAGDYWLNLDEAQPNTNWIPFVQMDTDGSGHGGLVYFQSGSQTTQKIRFSTAASTAPTVTIHPVKMFITFRQAF